MTLKEIYDKDKSAVDYLKKFKNHIVNYRLYDKINKKSYVGSSQNIWARLFNKRNGHVGSIFLNTKHDYIHTIILDVGLENIEFFIEKDGFNTIEDAEISESKLIEKYDSFMNGYNQTINGKGGYVGTIQVFKNDDTKRIKPSELDDYLKNGWTKGSGKTVITNPKTGKFKRVNSKELTKLLNDGWILGNKNLNTTGGKVYVYNPTTKVTKSIPKSEFDDYISNGWIKGSNFNKGRKELYNPETGDTVRTNDQNKINNLISSGYKFGSICRKGSYIMSLNKTVIKVPKELTNDYLKQGYKFGK